MHFLRNALAHPRKGQRQMVLAMIDTVFAQETLDAAIAQWRVVADQLRAKFPKLASMLDKSEADVLAFMSFPKAHRRQIHSFQSAGAAQTPRSNDAPTSSVSPQRSRVHGAGRRAVARAERRVESAAPLHAT